MQTYPVNGFMIELTVEFTGMVSCREGKTSSYLLASKTLTLMSCRILVAMFTRDM